MIKAFTLLAILVMTSSAAVYQYDYWVPQTIKLYSQAIEANSPAEGLRSCEKFYQPYLADDLLDIRYALGYFDVTTGIEVVDKDGNHGYSPSLDIEVFRGLYKAWTAPCVGKQKLCGFVAIGSLDSGKVFFQKTLKLQGKDVLARITLTQASASDSFVLNKTELLNRQKALTEQSEENYFGGLKTADMVFYNGHSRDGGGPDFTWPVLNSRQKTNYAGYYHVRKPGFKKMMDALKTGKNKDVVVGLFSCYSKRHFHSEFVANNPQQRMILSSDTVDYLDTLRGSIGYLEGFLRGSCGAELSQMARQTPSLQTGFLDYLLE